MKLPQNKQINKCNGTSWSWWLTFAVLAFGMLRTAEFKVSLGYTGSCQSQCRVRTCLKNKTKTNKKIKAKFRYPEE